MITLSERKKNYVNIVIPLKEGVASYKVYVANSLENAYNLPNSVNVFNVNHNKVFLSPSIKKSKNPRYELGTNRKTTRIVFDPMDYYDPTQNLPTDDQQLYLRVEEVNKGGVSSGLSPILVVPPATFFMFPSGSLTLAHSAVPNHNNVSAGSLPSPTDLSFVVPNYLNFFRLHVPNGATKNLLYSPSAGMPYVQVTEGDVLNLFSIANNQFFLACSTNGDTCAMDLFLTCSLDPIDG